jgi:hypothetical protein
MAGWLGLPGLRRRTRTEGLLAEQHMTRGQPVPGTSASSANAVAREWQWSGSPPGAGPSSASQPSGLVIRARRAGGVDPTPQPGPLG